MSAYHVDGLHPEVSRRLVRAMDAVSLNQTPPATVLTGERGSGKTHLLIALFTMRDNRGFDAGASSWFGGPTSCVVPGSQD